MLLTCTAELSMTFEERVARQCPTGTQVSGLLAVTMALCAVLAAAPVPARRVIEGATAVAAP
jgi:hypothetical protein